MIQQRTSYNTGKSAGRRVWKCSQSLPVMPAAALPKSKERCFPLLLPHPAQESSAKPLVTDESLTPPDLPPLVGGQRATEGNTWLCWQGPRSLHNRPCFSHVPAVAWGPGPRTQDSGEPGLWSQFLTLCAQRSHIISLNHSFLLCKIRTIVLLRRVN